MTTLKQSTAQKIVFVLKDVIDVEVAGLGTAFTLQISKNGGAFAGSAGTKAEIGSGWYSYTFTAGETDTAGPLAVKITHASIDQTNLEYQVTPSGWEAPAGTYILSTEEAANVLRCELDDANMLMLLPGIDAYIEQATGRDWAADTTVNELAKNVARMLLVLWHEDPGRMVAGSALPQGITACLTQLEAKAVELETSVIPDEELEIVGMFPKDNAEDVSITASMVLVFNNALAASATTAVTLKDAGGGTVATTNSLDATSKILTVNPDASLTNNATYTLVLAGVTDEFGQTYTETFGFTTEE